MKCISMCGPTKEIDTDFDVKYKIIIIVLDGKKKSQTALKLVKTECVLFGSSP